MKEKTKRIVFAVAAAFVIAIFLTGFLLNGTGGPNLSSGTINTAKNANVSVAFASGMVNTTVVGYSNILLINTFTQNYTNVLNSVLSNMENRGVVQDYNNIGNSFEVYLSNESTYAFLKNISYAMPSNSFSSSVQEYVRLPKSAPLRINGQTITVSFSNSMYKTTSTTMLPLNSTVKMLVSAIIAYQNSSYVVYNNNITVKGG